MNIYNPFSVVGFETPKLFGTFVAGSATDTSGIRVGAGALTTDSTPHRPVLVGPIDRGDTSSLSQSFDPVALGVFVG